MNTPQNFDKELAIKGAEALGLRLVDNGEKVIVSLGDGIDARLPRTTVFDPANNANDRDRLVEHFKIGVFVHRGHWWASANTDADVVLDNVFDQDRTTAIKMCLCKILEIDYE